MKKIHKISEQALIESASEVAAFKEKERQKEKEAFSSRLKESIKGKSITLENSRGKY